MKHMEEICEFLDTTPNYLFYGLADEDESLTPAEKDMILEYRNFDNGRKKCIRETLKYLSEGSMKRKKNG